MPQALDPYPGNDRLIALDTETALSTQYCKAPELACVSWARPDGSRGLFHWGDRDLIGWLFERLTCDWIIGHTVHYDMGVLLEWCRKYHPAHFLALVSAVFRAYRAGRILDIRLAQKLRDISDGEHESPRWMVNGAPYTLEALSKRHLARALDKDTWRKRYGELRELAFDLWPEGAKIYPVEDARATIDVLVLMRAKYGIETFGDLVRQTQHAFALHLVTCWGIRTDLELATEVKATAETRYRSLAAALESGGEIQTTAGARVNLPGGFLRTERGKWVKNMRVIQATVLRAYDALGEPAPLTDTGLKKKKAGEDVSRVVKYIASDAETCEDTADDHLLAFSEFNSLGTRLSTQFPHLLRGEIHSRFESLRETGRTSSGGKDGDVKGYNTQNPPTGDDAGIILGERECFIPRPGYVYGDNDYSGLEICTIGQMAVDLYGFSEIAKVVRTRGGDAGAAHTEFAATILGTTFEDAAKRKKAGDVIAVRARDTAKRCNFGLGGGMGKTRFAAICKTNGSPLDADWTRAIARAAELKDLWVKRWREMSTHFAWAKAQTGTFKQPKRARIKLLRVDRWRGGLKYTDVCNTPFQALGSDVAKDALFEVVAAQYDPAEHSVLYGSRVVNFVHDQIISEFPEHNAHECVIEQTRIMNEIGARWLPDCPVFTEPALARRWSKGAAKVVKDGRIVPWEHPTILARAA